VLAFASFTSYWLVPCPPSPRFLHQVNYDVPHEGRVVDAYPHRAGRTGRRGRPGTCLTLVAPAIALLATAAAGDEGSSSIRTTADAAAQAKAAAEAAATAAVKDMVKGGVDTEDAMTLCNASANSDGSCLELAQLLRETNVPLGDGFGGLVSHLEDVRAAAAAKESLSQGKRRGADDNEASDEDDDDASDESGDATPGSSQQNEPLIWTRAELREELVAFYSEVAPAKLSDVDRLVAKCWGNTAQSKEEKGGEKHNLAAHSTSQAQSSDQKGKRAKVQKTPKEEKGEEEKPLVDPNEVLAALRLKYR